MTKPLYDPTAPIACTIEAHEIPGHLELIERLRAHLASIERTEHGVRLTFAGAKATDIHRFAAEEKRCCAFWGFEVGDGTLRWDGPPQLADHMDRLIDYFEGRAPIGGVLL